MPIVNSAFYQEGNYFTSKGTRITAGNQPNIKGSAIAGIRDSSITSTDAANVTGFISGSPFVLYTGHDRRNVIMGLTNNLKGSANTNLRSAGAEAGRESVHQLDALRTHMVASGIRAGLWHEISGNFTTEPFVRNDFTAIGNDDSADANRANPGEFIYTWAGSGVRDTYNPRTQ